MATVNSGGASSAASAVSATTSSCTLNANLVPNCGLLWGAAPAAFNYSAGPATQIRRFESTIQRPLDIYHAYKSNADLFPTRAEREVATNPEGRGRLLFFNWRPATDHTWAQVAAGGIDARIDRLAAYIRGNYDRRFYLAIWHEPEHSVNQSAGSGMSASDYRNMVRHAILRLKAHGVSNAVFVQVFQGYPRYAAESWWPQMYPGDDVIDWLATDSYNSGRSTGWNSGDFDYLVNRTRDNWSGFYNWATAQHPGKPLMVSEWGVFANATEPSRQAWFFHDVESHLGEYPALKAMVYFNTSRAPKGSTLVDTNAMSLAAYRQLSASIPLISMP